MPFGHARAVRSGSTSAMGNHVSSGSAWYSAIERAPMHTAAPAATRSTISSTLSFFGAQTGEDPSGRGFTAHQSTQVDGAVGHDPDASGGYLAS
ncbi:hypothetical protein FE391_12300 [Nonomuraea sp. KC401]|uniref:hypothetical protein n=1 Tax=unclassified Nonomuraea TaxID=2593643 RepID=UPI0010FF5AE1|nr:MULTISPECIES: hypothetical protein [unclassified Nonomuraea]NBE95919.1 hypothetical protein [Nonomuraea sp. K271]TLF76279.1 hypothetical protein FE391_12300 [Nonomuraea sp. KC401]